jgi:uncharacterized membrane protein
MSRFQSIFLRGLVVTLPVTLTITFLVWVIGKFEQILAPIWEKVLGPENYIVGLGLVSSFALVMVIGIMVDNYLTQKIIQSFMNQFSKFPVVKTIYGPIRDFVTLIGGQSSATSMKNVVLYEVKPSTWMIGLVTRENFNDPKLKIFAEMDLIPVYMPSSFMFGGYTILVNRNQVKPIDLPVETAIKLAITGWVHVDTPPK